MVIASPPKETAFAERKPTIRPEPTPSACLGWRVVTCCGARPEFSISYYITVAAIPTGGIGGLSSVIFRARRTR
jgi:hypothetical protein